MLRLPCWVRQVKKLLLVSDKKGESVLHTIAMGGNIGVWAVVVDIFKEQGVLEEVGVGESRAVTTMTDDLGAL